MALFCDELECNPFFRTLQTKYAQKFEVAQKKCCIICVPCRKSIKGLYISQELIDAHILKPSPFYKSHFLSADRESKSYELENDAVKTPSGGKIKILTEETGYNEDYKTYRILVIEQPLNFDSVKKKSSGINDSSTISGVETFFQPSECLKYLQLFPETLNMLDKKINQFSTSYMVLPDYLPDAAIKLKSIIDWAKLMFSQSSKWTANNMANCGDTAVSIEFYILNRVHSKIFPVIKKKFCAEDKDITNKLFSLYEANVSPDQLGIKEPFCCPTPGAVVELASLNLKNNPIEKLICLMTTLELLNQDIEKSLQEIYSPLNPNKDVPCLSSDDLIPLLINVMIQARPMYLASNLYFVQNFCWHLSVKDKLSFSLVTFQAAKEFLTNNAIKLKKPVIKVKKEMTLEELIQMTVEMQDHTKASSEKNANSSHSTIDTQLENVTKMIEASTRELRQWPHDKDF